MLFSEFCTCSSKKSVGGPEGVYLRAGTYKNRVLITAVQSIFY